MTERERLLRKHEQRQHEANVEKCQADSHLAFQLFQGEDGTASNPESLAYRAQAHPAIRNCACINCVTHFAAVDEIANAPKAAFVGEVADASQFQPKKRGRKPKVQSEPVMA